MIKQLFFGLIGAFAINTSYAVTYTVNENGETIGQNKQVTLKKGESLSTVAKRYGVAVREVIAANPSIAGEKRLPAGTRISIPSQSRLPSGPHTGIILNLAELKIYYFHPDGKKVSIYPVAAGKQGWSTPQGTTTIVAKQKDPAWRPPKSIRRESARRGRSLPLVIAPGPHNPLGRYAMRLGISGILIHGTNKPQSIGTRSSHGCIRMYAKDIKELFSLVSVGTDVRIVSETKSQIAAKQAAARLAAQTQQQTQPQTQQGEGTKTAPEIVQTTQSAQTAQSAQNAQATGNQQSAQTIQAPLSRQTTQGSPSQQESNHESNHVTHNKNAVPVTQQNSQQSTHAHDVKDDQRTNNEQASSNERDTKS